MIAQLCRLIEARRDNLPPELVWKKAEALEAYIDLMIECKQIKEITFKDDLEIIWTSEQAGKFGSVDIDKVINS